MVFVMEFESALTITYDQIVAGAESAGAIGKRRCLAAVAAPASAG